MTVLGLEEEEEPLEEVPAARGEVESEIVRQPEGEIVQPADHGALHVASELSETSGLLGTAPDAGPSLADVLLVGSTPSSSQFGVIGRVAGSGRDVAFDTDGTNVVSVFGVRGSGRAIQRANAFAERWVRTVRTECLAWTIVFLAAATSSASFGRMPPTTTAEATSRPRPGDAAATA